MEPILRTVQTDWGGREGGYWKEFGGRGLEGFDSLITQTFVGHKIALFK